nr:hypothetical protein [Acidobacteriota bacterium]
MFAKLPFNLLCLFAACAATLVVLAGEAEMGVWRWQNPQPQGNPLYAVRFSDIRRGIAVGRDGAILRTSDSGKHWESSRSPVNTPLYGLAVVEKKAWAVGARGEILFSDDHGESWRALKSRTKKHLYSVWFNDEKRGWAVGIEGLILTTSDGGEHWVEQKSGTTKQLLGVAFSDNKTGIAVGAEGLLLATSDGGASWQVRNQNSSA